MKIADMTLEELTQTLKGAFVQCDDCDKRHEQLDKKLSNLTALETENRDKIDDIRKGVNFIKKAIPFLTALLPTIASGIRWLLEHLSL